MTEDDATSARPQAESRLVAQVPGVGGALEAALVQLVRTVVRQELDHYFESKLKPLLQAAASPASRTLLSGLLSTEEAARTAGVTPATVREWAKSGKLPSQRAGRLLRIRASALELFLASSGDTENVVDLDAEALRILGGRRRR